MSGKVFHCFSIVISYCFQRLALLFYNQEYTISLDPVSKKTKLMILKLTDVSSGHTSIHVHRILTEYPRVFLPVPSSIDDIRAATCSFLGVMA